MQTKDTKETKNKFEFAKFSFTFSILHWKLIQIYETISSVMILSNDLLTQIDKWDETVVTHITRLMFRDKGMITRGWNSLPYTFYCQTSFGIFSHQLKHEQSILNPISTLKIKKKCFQQNLCPVKTWDWTLVFVMSVNSSSINTVSITKLGIILHIFVGIYHFKYVFSD